MAVLRRCRGLHTFNNELNEVEGGLEKADNVVIDANDTLELRRGFSEYGEVSDNRIDQIIPYKETLIRHGSDKLEFDTNLGDFSQFSGSYLPPIGVQRIKYMEGKGNLLFTTNEGIKKISATNSSQLTASPDFITNAGGVKAVDINATVRPQVGGFLLPQSKVAYRLVWGIRDNNGNLIFGTPSSRALVTNTSQSQSVAEQFALDFTIASESDLAGNYMLVSSPNVDYVVWWSNSANNTQPITSETLGRTFLEIDIDGFGAVTSTIVNTTASRLSTISEFNVTIDSTIVTLVSNSPGENLKDASLQSGGINNVSLTIIDQGVTLEGSSSIVDVSFTIPTDVNNTNYFYQLYRTQVTTVPTGLTIDDIDPGEEMNLVFEQGVTEAQIASGEVTIEDITPDDFRASGTLLYTNPISGQGILQANERPPIAKDVELFRDTVFYANTFSVHRSNIDLLSATGFTTGVTNLVVTNSEVSREYIFAGINEDGNIVCDTVANTTESSSILINSARDERKYYIWFDKGSGVDPLIAGRIGIKVDLADIVTASEVSLRLSVALNSVNDFVAIDNSGSVDFSNVKAGFTEDITFGPTSPGGLWAVNVITQGVGEDTSAQQILISTDTSTAQAIDETARSIVKVINRDSLSPINAFYVSNADDLPGKIRFENKNQKDEPFNISTNDTNVVSKFSPDLSVTETITNISIAENAVIESLGHGLATGDKVFIYNTNSSPTIQAEFEVTFVDVDNYSIPFQTFGTGDSGFWTKSSITSSNDESPNRVYFSKTGLHEAVPLLNFIDIGPKDKAIQRIIALRDNLFVLKEDGVYIVTGSSSPNFGSRALDNSTDLLAPDTAAVLNNQIYALTSQGVVTITEGGVSIISRPIEDLILGVANSRFDYELKSFATTYESDRAYLLWMPTVINDEIATQCFRYNIFTATWTRWTKPATCAILNPADDKLYVGGDSNFVLQERKNGDRTDHSDEDFALSIPSDSVDNVTIKLSSAQDVSVGDVILQNQYITNALLKRLLRRLDIDGGLDDTDYESLISSVGGRISVNLNNLNDKLILDDSSNTITDHKPFSDNFEQMKDQFNSMIDELNNTNSDTLIKDYDKTETIVPYEVLITEVNVNTNTVTVNVEAPFLEGDITVYKGFKSVIEWLPQHFGSPESLKQVRESTILFDQNNFYTALMSFASDLRQDFRSVPIRGRGVGNYGYNIYGEDIYGGLGNDVPFRTYVPLEKQRCRYITVRFTHLNSREVITIVGISLEPRMLSKRAYR